MQNNLSYPKRGLRHLAMMLTALLLPALCVCCADDIPSSPGAEDDGPGLWMSIRVSMPAATRSNPSGGENGDGLEPGIWYENDINNLNLFIYHDDANEPAEIEEAERGALNAPADTPVRHIYLDENKLNKILYSSSASASSVDYDYRFLIPNEEVPTDGDIVIAVANMGDMSDQSDQSDQSDLSDQSDQSDQSDLSDMSDRIVLSDYHLSLGQLRDMIIEKSWTPGATIPACTGFVMSNAYNNHSSKAYNRIRVNDGTTGDRLNTGTKEFPFTAQIALERAAARIELMYDADALKVPGNDADASADNRVLVYNVTGSDGVIATVSITHVVPVNVMQQGSFLLKHLTATTTLSSWPSDISAIHAGVSAQSWPTSLPLYMARDESVSDGVPTNYVVEPSTATKANLLLALSQSESATEKANPLTSVSQGVIKGWYGATATSAIESAGASAFTDARRIAPIIANGSLTVSEGDWKKSMVICYAEENTHPVLSSLLTTEPDANGDLYRHFATGLLFRAIYCPKTVYSGIEETTDKEGKEITALVVDTDYSYGKTFWRYAPTRLNAQNESTCLYFKTEAAALAYAALNPDDLAEISEFKNGECYYNLWLRHANLTDKDNAGSSLYHRPMPMEFATVRNNIYRVGISFSGAGNPTLEIREPHNIRPRIFVRKWNPRPQPGIIL